ncbi:hypothetical protein M0G43_05930 [Subsaxibacter sp. CAU 1640]|uniref:hypothetical protein n=1 Tax=Subsaxibacter sp. CAU 1640 TaxID=2933271 RepID=UPI002004F8B2|nr:hypothetical protein [Subsaxibacter sp. CAU 1640]MCK7590103.1 hypothetical protein [Subsaxibacter sp. CAU 1640]
MKKRNTYFMYTILVILFGCTNASEDDLIDQTELPEVVTFVEDVQPIINNNCVMCHTNPPENGAPMPLLSYDNVKDAVLNRGLISRISSEDLGFLMPFGGPRLPQNLIDTIIQWEEDGLLEE